MTQLPQPFDPNAAVFPVSIAAELAGMHAQTLRGYDRLGLVVPQRARGRGRRYSLRDIAKLRHIQHLSQEEGINLEGIRRILQLEDEIEALRGHVEHLSDIVEELQSSPAARIFTADMRGGVRPGRSLRRAPRALDWRGCCLCIAAAHADDPGGVSPGHRVLAVGSGVASEASDDVL